MESEVVDKCAECGQEIPASKSMYAHTLGCLNVLDRGIAQLKNTYGSQTSENAQRVMRNLALAEKRGE